MATRYVGPGGNDGNSGLTWALRKLTLNGVEDTPVVAGDVVYVGPGVYREILIIDVSGAGGNLITYIADVTGENTDDVGGVVRITGSNDDQTNTRAYCIQNAAFDYRTFRGFRMDMTSSAAIYTGGAGSNWIIEDCTICENFSRGIHVVHNGAVDWTIRRCYFYLNGFMNIQVAYTSEVDDCGWLIENCIFIGSGGATDSISILFAGDLIIKNCTLLGAMDDLIDVAASPNVGHPILVYNCILAHADSNALEAVALGDLVEDYNTFWENANDRSFVATGANSEAWPPLFVSPILYAGNSQNNGIKFPFWFSQLSEWSPIRALTGSNEPSIDIFGIDRPVTASKNSWGPVQFFDMERETGTVRTGVASLALHDAGRHQIWTPVTGVEITISVYVYREANYAGNLPQMTIKQPGQADDVTTDVGAAGGWNLLTTTLTPAAEPPYVVVELISRNTAVALAYEVFFDDLDVS